MNEQELEVPEYLKDNAPGETDYFGVMDEMAVEATDIGHRLLNLVDKASHWTVKSSNCKGAGRKRRRAEDPQAQYHS